MPVPLTSLLSAKVAAAAVATVLGAGGIATAAYAGALPAPLQDFAHSALGAPAATSSPAPGTHPSRSATPAGPDASGPAAFGLCTAYQHAQAHGTKSQQAVAFQNLAAAAGGAANVSAYCAAVPHPGASASPSSHASGAPSSHPSGAPSSHPSGDASSHPSGAPSSHPSGKP